MFNQLVYDVTQLVVVKYPLIGFLVPASLMAVGLFGVVYYRADFIRFIVALELCLLATNLYLLIGGVLLAVPAVSVQVYVPLVLTIAACEAAVGLGLVSVSYWRAGTTKLEHFENLKG